MPRAARTLCRVFLKREDESPEQLKAHALHRWAALCSGLASGGCYGKQPTCSVPATSRSRLLCVKNVTTDGTGWVAGDTEYKNPEPSARPNTHVLGIQPQSPCAKKRSFAEQLKSLIYLQKQSIRESQKALPLALSCCGHPNRFSYNGAILSAPCDIQACGPLITKLTTGPTGKGKPQHHSQHVKHRFLAPRSTITITARWSH